MEKPMVTLFGVKGNIYNLMAIASQALKREGQREQTKEMQNRITAEANNYDEVLQIIMEYIEFE